jgi:hypothetical protein
MEYEYYYNVVPGAGLCRNNLIYTSLISQDKKVFVQHYLNDTEYHRGQNQIVDPDKMTEKWTRELCYLSHMELHAPECIPKVLDIDLIEKKIYLEIDGVDFWQRSLDGRCSFDEVLPDWQEQMLSIIQKYKDLGLYKYSMHPSSYFIVDGKLKSINYFFTYSASEEPITVNSFLSHVSEGRQKELKQCSDQFGIDWDTPTALKDIQILCWETFRKDYPEEFINKAIEICIK